jgi:hypothetical protein
MRLWFPGLIAALVLVAGTGIADARVGFTTTDLTLRTAPSPRAAVLLTVPAGAKVRIGGCTQGWCRVSWQSETGYGRASGLAVQERRSVSTRPVYDPQPEVWPIYPPYPYRAGHYPKADWYHAMPPYVAISPSFYRKRTFLTPQERNRYRYMPHIFYGQRYDDDGGAIEDIDIRGISASLRETYSE